MALCSFGEALLFTHESVAGPFKTVTIPALASKADYNTFMLRSLRQQIRTSFALVIQWDGYVSDPESWKPEFRHYDYIGARWPWHTDGLTVGNGGFSLRSKKLLDAIADPEFQIIPDAPEDNLICRSNRTFLESKHGIRFAPDAVADAFAYERVTPTVPTFGFHGLFTFWRHTPDEQVIAMLDQFSASIVTGREYLELMLAYFELQRAGPFQALYKKLRAHVSPQDIHGLIAKLTNNTPFAQSIVQTGERLLAAR